MTIKHLVLCGGGPIGFKIIGALQVLHENNFWNIEEIESIYGTSIGSIIGAFLCLKYDWETLNKYIIERPWKDVFKVTAKQLFDSYNKKGLFDKRVVEIILKPLLKAKDLQLNITLKQLYEYSKIDLHIFTFDINKFATVELSHNTHPNLLLTEAITMSSALPGLFMPIIIDNCCYIDGGVMCNYPINECIRDHSDTKEILGFKIAYISETKSEELNNKEINNEYSNETINSNTSEPNIILCPNEIVKEESSLLEYIISLTINAANFIRESVKLEKIDNTVQVLSKENPLGLDVIKKTLYDSEIRRKYIEEGIEDGLRFIKNKKIEVINNN